MLTFNREVNIVMREAFLDNLTKEELEKINGGVVKAGVYRSNELFESVIDFVDSIKEKMRGND